MTRAWTAVEKVAAAGLLITVAGLLVAVVALLRDFYDWSFEPQLSPEPAITTTDQPSRQPPPRPPADVTPVRVLPRAAERVGLPPGRGLDLDTVPATITTAEDGRADVLKISFSDVDPGRGVTLSDPTADRPATDDCRDRLGGAGIPSFGPEAGQFICVRTTEGNLVLVQYLGLDDDAVFGFTVSSPG